MFFLNLWDSKTSFKTHFAVSVLDFETSSLLLRKIQDFVDADLFYEFRHVGNQYHPSYSVRAFAMTGK
jgi:hypothetical protein